MDVSIKKIMTPLIVLIVGACAIPMSGDYYYPSGVNGTITAEYCHSSVGPKNGIRFEIGKSYLDISAVSTGKSLTHINLLVYGDDFARVGFEGDKVTIYDDDDGKSLVQVNIKNTSDPGESSYSFDVNAVPHRLEVKMHMVMLDGKQYENINATFTDEFGVWFEVPNC